MQQQNVIHVHWCFGAITSSLVQFRFIITSALFSSILLSILLS